LYGGQALPEGVMMRGAAHWAVAVREPGGDLFVRSYEIGSARRQRSLLRKPLIRGVVVLGQSVAIGMRALMIATNASAGDDVDIGSREMAVVLALAALIFVGVFILAPAALFGWVSRATGGSVLTDIGEGILRVAMFVGYLWLIGRMKSIDRVFQYHGAEHKTIAAHEHNEPLDPAAIAKYPKEHVRCGTNFLIIVMLVTILVFAPFQSPDLAWRLGSRLIAIPVIAAVAYEALRLGARFPHSALMRALMAPGLWLQAITTKEPERDQIEVAVASLREVLRREAETGAPA
jgi:uncharacterized protein YqhQ